MASQNRSLASKDVNGEKWDRCITDTLVKTGWNMIKFYSLYIIIILASGLALGIVFSAILFKRKTISF
jgi:hypothetical protein